MRDSVAVHRRSPAPVRAVRDRVRGAVRAQTRAVIGMCGVCGVALTRARVGARERCAAFTQKGEFPVHVASTPHTPHTSASVRVSARTDARTAPRTPRTDTFFRARFIHHPSPEREEVEVAVEDNPPVAPAITCGPENVQHFNARLRTELPEFHAFAKALHERGLIDGLRGARIGPVDSLERRGVVPVLSAASESRLADRKAATQEKRA